MARTKQRNLHKKGYVATLPFLALCLFFLLISIIALVFAVLIKAPSDDDQKLKTTLSSNAILLDYAKTKSVLVPMYEIIADVQHMGAQEVPYERQLLDSVLGAATNNCYLLKHYTFDSADKRLILQMSYSPKRMRANCADIGPTSALFLPNAAYTIETESAAKTNPIPGVTIS